MKTDRAIRKSRRMETDRSSDRDDAAAMIALKRAYDPVSRTDGTRFLVERLWPRGVSKEKLNVDAWLKEAGPSTELRKWFGHDPLKWGEFRRRYFRELGSRPEAWQPIVAAARRGRVTLVYSSHDTEHNNAVALLAYLRRKKPGPARSKRPAATEPAPTRSR
jgi:uncharacterized protein YeaO (DUF488 family)